MKIAVLKERAEGETRVALTPETAKKFIALGADVAVEAGAGENASIADAAYTDAGASVGTADQVVTDAGIVLGVQAPDPALLKGAKPDAKVAALFDPFRDGERVDAYAKAGLEALSMEFMPRITRAQSMDVLSSQSNLAGYKAVLLGAAAVGCMIPMMMTSAGTVRPAKYVVMGAGVAGLQAIATAKRLGAVVWASDVRLAAKEQIESLGGKFIAVEGMEDFEDESGYAKPLTPEFIQKVNDTVYEVARDADVVVTTARLFGRAAPITVPASAVEAMKPGAVVIDMNTASGGNCELSEPGKTTTVGEVTIVAPLNVPSMLAEHASEMYARNLLNLMELFIKEGELTLDLEDDVIKGALLTHDGEIVNEQAKQILEGSK